MRTVAIIQAIHLGSRRVPRKLLETIGNQTLLASGLAKLQLIKAASGVPTIFAVSYEDQVLCEAVDRAGFERIEIGQVAAAADSYQTVFTEWTEQLAGRFDWVIDANLICRPFLRVETVLDLIERARTAPQPFVACLEERGLLWNGSGEMLLGEGQVADTKNNPRYHRLAQLAYAHPADLWEERALSAAARPEPILLSAEERIDIDTPEDLAFARLVADGRRAAGAAVWGGHNAREISDVIPAVVCAPGPSFRQWAGAPLPAGSRVYGCGRVADAIRLDLYAVGDIIHYPDIPLGALTYATASVISGCPAGTLLYDEVRLPHGGSSGGMAISLAANHHKTIFLAGFDGYPDDPASNEIVFQVIRYWRGLGREFYSLTPTILDIPLHLPG